MDWIVILILLTCCCSDNQCHKRCNHSYGNHMDRRDKNDRRDNKERRGKDDCRREGAREERKEDWQKYPMVGSLREEAREMKECECEKRASQCDR